MIFFEYWSFSYSSLVSSKLVSQDKLHIKMQLHIHKLALGFATEPELERIWNLLDRTKQRIKFQHLVMPRVSLPRFEGQVMDVKRMLEQTQLGNLMSILFGLQMKTKKIGETRIELPENHDDHFSRMILFRRCCKTCNF